MFVVSPTKDDSGCPTLTILKVIVDGTIMNVRIFSFTRHNVFCTGSRRMFMLT